MMEQIEKVALLRLLVLLEQDLVRIGARRRRADAVQTGDVGGDLGLLVSDPCCSAIFTVWAHGKASEVEGRRRIDS